jgi:hypothetical protein
MKKVLVILFFSIALISCEESFDSVVPCHEGVEATVRNLTGLDGCGFIFELENGAKLEPLRQLYCGTPPLPKEVTEDPLFDFEWVNGKKVRIGYEETKALSICMAGPVVKITCLTEVDTSGETPE